MPAAEVDVTEDLVRGLLADQHPDLAHLPLSLVANGWDNMIFRLGDELTVRVPRRQLAADPLRNEQRWLQRIARGLPIPVPAPVRLGRPGRGFPWEWTVTPWFEGEMAADVELDDPVREAERLGAFVRALHRPTPPDAPVNPFLRGQHVGTLTERVHANLERLDLDRTDELSATWSRLSGADPWDDPPVWVHGDLHSANVLVDRGSISAVIDFGDMAAGDPAVDLAIGWMLFDDESRPVFRSSAGAGDDDQLWMRAEAWALHFALLYLANSADNPRFDRMGRELLARVLSPVS